MAFFPKLSSDTILAPMAKVTDVAYRELCKKYGCGLTFTEMISVKDLAQKEKQAVKEISQLAQEQKPRGIQLYGSVPTYFQKATVQVQNLAEVLDLNFGCPDKNIVAEGAGSALLLHPEKIAQIVKTVVSLSRIPVSCKIRLGMDAKNITVMEVAKKCEDAGAAMITVHPRTQKQEYSGKADWSWIKKVKEAVKIPVCGNGDVKAVEDYIRMKKETSCDYVMIGRGAIGNPYLFKQIAEHNKTGKYNVPSKEERIGALREYLELAEKFEIEFAQVKKQAMYFLERTLPDRDFKEKLEECGDKREIKGLLKEL